MNNKKTRNKQRRQCSKERKTQGRNGQQGTKGSKESGGRLMEEKLKLKEETKLGEKENKKFWEEIIACFPSGAEQWIAAGHRQHFFLLSGPV
jgi:hypothetical protein